MSELDQVLAFCEPSNAITMGREHLRRLTTDSPARGTGFPAGTRALCGRDLHAGWDLPDPVTWDTLISSAQPREHDGRPWICQNCHEAALAEFGPAPTASDEAP